MDAEEAVAQWAHEGEVEGIQGGADPFWREQAGLDCARPAHRCCWQTRLRQRETRSEVWTRREMEGRGHGPLLKFGGLSVRERLAPSTARLSDRW